jgi:hypothetical protein
MSNIPTYRNNNNMLPRIEPLFIMGKGKRPQDRMAKERKAK